MNTNETTSLFNRAVSNTTQLSDTDAVHLMKLLRLPLSYFVAVQEAIRQGRWRDKKDPIGYVRTVAKAEAVKLGFEDPREKVHLMVPRFDDEGKPLSHDDYIEYLDQPAASGIPSKRAGVWHAAEADWSDEEHYDGEGDRIPQYEELASMLAPAFERSLKRHKSALDSPGLDWAQIGRAAGLDADECHILGLRATGVSRERAIAAEPPERRKQIQAAWRRFDRHDRLKQIAVVLKNISPQE